MNYDNPFPGMNPYLEHRDIWPDFHDDLAAQLRGTLGPQLPDRYRIALQRRVEVAEPFGDPPGLALMIPDALVTSEPGGPASGRSATAVMEATTTVAAPPDGASAVRVRMPREIRVTWLRVERAPNREVVTIDDAIPDAPRPSYPSAKSSPSAPSTPSKASLQKIRQRAFYPRPRDNYGHLFPKLPARSRLFRRWHTQRYWTGRPHADGHCRPLRH